jgi:hypothetical protein
MIFVVSRGLLFLLLAVDWAEDTHFGQYAFSCPMASTDVSLLDPTFHPAASKCQNKKKVGDGLHMAEFSLIPASPRLALQANIFSPINCTIDSLYLFMSLQQ